MQDGCGRRKTLYMTGNYSFSGAGSVALTLGTINLRDGSINNFNLEGISVTDAAGADLTSAGLVSSADDLSDGQWGYTFSDNTLTLVATSSVVPEPTAATLSLLALVGLVARRRRK